MKSNVLAQRIDVETIDKSIKIYASKYNKFPDYIIMNEETKEMLKEIAFENYYYEVSTNNVNTYCGVNIAICNSLSTGEIDVIGDIEF